MNRLSVSVAVLAGLAGASVAQADLFSQINSVYAANHWFGDYGGLTTVNITNGGLPSYRIQETGFFPPNPVGYADRNIGFLAVNGAAYQFNPQQAFRADFDVIINSTTAACEVGWTLGTAPNLPASGAANTGDFHIRVNDGEIAAFGGVNPFFSSNQLPPNTPGGMLSNGNSPVFPAIVRNVTYHMTLIYNTSPGGSSMNFGVNNVFTGNLTGVELLPGSYLGVFAQGPNTFPYDVQGAATDVTFTNITIQVPTPATATLLGMGGLVALRRRRR